MIRPATVDDASQIASIHVRGWQAIYRDQLPDELLDNLSTAGRAADWTEIIASGAEQVAVFQVADGVAGFVSVGRSSDRDAGAATGELSAIYVEPASWRRGIGSRLIDWIKLLARANGWTTLTLWVMRGNQRARSFYESAGWKLDGAVKTTLLDGAEVNLVRYRCGRLGLPADDLLDETIGITTDR